MALRIKLGGYRPLGADEQAADPFRREWVGYFPRIGEAEVWEQNRGVWKMNRDRAGRQRFALITGGSTVLAVAQITGITQHGDRQALEGHILEAGHPVYDAYIGGPDPVESGSQNPIAYCDLPEEAAFLSGPCACGCGEDADRDFLPGHDLRAIMARVRENFGGNVLTFLGWLDDNKPVPGQAGTGQAGTVKA